MEILEYLDSAGFEYQLFEHESVTSVAVGKDIYTQNNIPGIQVKSLFLRNKNGKQHFLLIVPAEAEVDLRDISEQAQAKKLGFASQERLWKYLQVKPGSVSPLSLVNDSDRHVIVLFDQQVLEADMVHLHPGDNTKSVALAMTDLKDLMKSMSYEILIVQTNLEG